MKNTLVLFALLITFTASAQNRRTALLKAATDTGSGEPTPDYTVCASGCDYSTVAQVNAATFAAGDYIAFARGEDFSNGTSLNAQSGTSGSPIIYGAFGTGARPRLSGVTCDGEDYVTLQYLDIDAENTRITTIGMYDVNHITVDSCLVGNTSEQNAIYIGPATYVTITRCEIRNTTYDATEGKNTHCIYISGETTTGTHYITVEYCDIYGGQTCGIQMNPNGATAAYRIDSAVIHHNRIHGNEVGVGDYGTLDLHFYNNEIFDNTGIDYYNDQIGTSITSTDAHIWNNTIYNLNPGWGESIGFYYCTNYEFKNNIVHAPNDNIMWLGTVTNFTADYNMYQFGTINWDTWANWQSAGYDANGADDNAEMNAPASGDFTLSTSSPVSPAIDAGTNVGLPYNGTAPDIGANETD